MKAYLVFTPFLLKQIIIMRSITGSGLPGYTYLGAWHKADSFSQEKGRYIDLLVWLPQYIKGCFTFGLQIKAYVRVY
jgi:hypothetical protein